MRKLLFLSLVGLVMLGAASCSKKSERSDTTGWKYNDKEWGAIEKKTDYEGQITGPNLVFIEGGTFTMGQTEEDVMFEYRNIPRRITVSSFYMDETEVSNIAYKEYLQWLARVFKSYPSVYNNALPDTLVWREELAYNEPFVQTYFRHPSYDNYPVVGVSWLQATEYCKWRTDRVNEMLLIERGIIEPNFEEQVDANNFNTGAYLAGKYEAPDGPSPVKDVMTDNTRPVKFEDGILLPDYRLPTEAEWEFAALGLVGNQPYSRDERITDRRIYPWNGTSMRYPQRGRYQGDIVANFKRGRGDYMGTAGELNDKAHITAPVRSFMPNDYGLYNMAGNVNEWVQDVYRPLTSITARDVENHDLNYYRGNEFEELVVDRNGVPVDVDTLGRLKYKPVDEKSTSSRLNYQRPVEIDYLDGDAQSDVLYGYGMTSLISNKARVYKGGSWADRAYYLSPGTRRFLDEDRASRTIGFRCAMTRMGSPEGNFSRGGNHFGKRRRSGRRR